jgi:hypothetical protein
LNSERFSSQLPQSFTERAENERGFATSTTSGKAVTHACRADDEAVLTSESIERSPISPSIQTDFVFPTIDAETLERYLNYYRSVGFIPDPL